MPVDWAKGVGYSIMASIIGGASKLAIRKSWLMVADRNRSHNPNSTHEDTAVEKIFAENSTYESPKRIHASSPADKTSNSALEVASETGEEAEASGRLTPLPSHGANMELGSAFSTESEILALPTAGTRGASSNQRNEAATQKNGRSPPFIRYDRNDLSKPFILRSSDELCFTKHISTLQWSHFGMDRAVF